MELAKIVHLIRKMMMIVPEVVLIEYFEKRQIVTWAYYRSLFNRLKAEIAENSHIKYFIIIYKIRFEMFVHLAY